MTFFKSEDIAAQAVVGGQADVGVGTPYALLQKVKAPIRIFYQMSTLRFFPVVNTEFYKDLEGPRRAGDRGACPRLRHRGHHELMAQQQRHQLQQHQLRAGRRRCAPARCCRATSRPRSSTPTNRRMLEEKARRQVRVLPIEGVNATDEALFANTDSWRTSQAAVDILVEELLNTWREINANPACVAELRKKYNLLPDLPAELERRDRALLRGLRSPTALSRTNGGGEAAAKDDFEFYAVAGQIEGDPATLKVEDFWALRAAERARWRKLGQV